jgi:murein DD-endopeptidase MepM/ murein hydrolase activator NlpD
MRSLAVSLLSVVLIVAQFTGSPGAAYAAEMYPMTFPVQGDNHYTDTFGAPRSGGRTHAGIDIMADKMVPVVAAQSGTIGWMHDVLCLGLAAR